MSTLTIPSFGSTTRPAARVEVHHPVDLDGLVVDSILDFDLYLQTSRTHYVLFRSHNLPFSLDHRNRLLENGVRTMFIRQDERGQYGRYLERNIGAVLGNPDVPEKKKATMLYSVSRTVVRDALTEPGAATVVPRARRLASETVDYVLKHEGAIGQLAAIMATDYYTFTHSVNVAMFVVSLAQQAGVARDEVKDLATGALLHDLGKSQVPVEILRKTGPLTSEEMWVVRQHVVWGEQLLASPADLSPAVLLPVQQHHEKLDGSGYPRQLRGDHIHLFGRITAIADCFDAMTTNRTYQQAMSAFDALHVMKTDLGAKYDQELVARFIRVLKAPTN